MPLTDAEEPTGLDISMPMDGFSEASLDNLRKLVDSKATLIKKALAVEALPIKVNDDRVSFHWFSEMPESEDTQAYMAHHGTVRDSQKSESHCSPFALVLFAL